MSTSSYLMDDPREGQRLASKVDPEAWADEYLAPHICTGSRVLDVGCGPGVILAAAASLAPLVAVTGLDASADRVAQANANLADFSCASAVVGEAGALPFADGAFDLVYSRFLLEYLPDPQQAVAEMARVCTDGGRVLLHDLDGQLVWHHPADEELERELAAALELLRGTGFDPFVGRKLFAFARAAGLADVHVRVAPYHLYAGRIDDTNLQQWELKLDIAAHRLAPVLGPARAERLRSRFLDYLQRDDTLTYAVAFTVVGTKRGLR